jgi:ethanolamine utilization protein EutA
LPHGVADHAYGQDLNHLHKPGASYDHEHDHFDDDGPLEENPLWIADHVSLVSVGIDIGSSGTQVIFSRVNLRRMGEDMSSRYFVTSRETLFESPVALTPYQSETRIDESALGDIIDGAYHASGLRPEDIDTGAVILTGEALRRENAEAISAILAEKGGDFVCATAGHHMEAMLAAYGSGAAGVSSDTGKRVLNIDIGGGTTKLGIIEHGRVVSTAAFHVGGRLVVVDAAGRLTRLDPAGRHLAHLAGFHWHLGDIVTRADLARVAEWMAEAVIRAVRDCAPVPEIAGLFLTDPLAAIGPIDSVMFSGGVAEYVYGREDRDFGDMGRLFGTALRRRLDAGALPWELLPAQACIRATALGASEYSIQLSGNTISISNPGALLPRRNLQVLAPPFDFSGDIDPAAFAAAAAAHFTAFDLVEGAQDVALALRWRGLPEYGRVAALARAVIAALPSTIAAGRPIYLILDGDLAQTLGAVLREDFLLANDILVIDGVVLWDFDYVDLGRIRIPSGTVPVTVKSLVFGQDGGAKPDAPHYDHDHHHHNHDHGQTHGHGHAHAHTPHSEE